jgi:hypothetical protein
MKSKMPCPPGFVPVANVDQATGVWAGLVVATREKPPWPLNLARLGSSPDASMGGRRSSVRAHHQITIPS